MAAVLAVAPLLATCTDGVAPTLPVERSAQLAVAPHFAPGLSTLQAQPINRIRITAFLVPGDSVLTRPTFDVDPNAAAWSLEVAIPFPAALERPRFYALLELIHVSGGAETVEWSGRTRQLDLDISNVPEIQDVPVVRGPIQNLAVTSLAILDHPELFEEGASISLTAAVTPATLSPPPVVFWGSLTPGVATVNAQGSVTFTAPGEARIVATAGTRADTASMRVLQRPTGARIIPATRTLLALRDTFAFRASLVDARGDTLPPASFRWSVPNAEVVRNLGGGSVEAVAPGRTTITAVADRDSTFTATAEVIVAPVAARLDVQPFEVYLEEVGDRIRLEPSARDANGFPVADPGYVFTSLNQAVASVDATGQVTATGVGVTAIVVGTGQLRDTVSVTVANDLQEVSVTPAEVRLTSTDQRFRFSARALDSQRQPIASITRFQWSVDDTTVAAVDSTGVVTARRDGRATLTARVGRVAGTASIEVARTASRVTVEPAVDTLRALGDTLRLRAQAVDSAGRSIPSLRPTWESRTPEVATVDSTGVVRARAVGEATIAATAGGLTGTATVVVVQRVASIAVSPDPFAFGAVGSTQQFTATALDARGHEVPGVEGFTWSSSDTSVVRVSASGLATSVANGVARIVARRGDLTGSAEVTVGARVARVIVVPNQVVFEVGGRQQFGATAVDAQGVAVARITSFAWSSSDTSVVRVDGSGVATALKTGTATVRAEADGVAGLATVEVNLPIDSVVVAPRGHDFDAIGDTVRFSGTAFDADGARVTTVSSFDWTSSDTAVVRIDARGLATAVGAGSAVITATVGAASGTAAVTVVAPVASVAVSPASHAFADVGRTKLFTAAALDARGDTLARVSTFAWSSSDSAVARVDASGLVTAVGQGSAIIQASAEGVSGTSNVTVAISVASIRVTPATGSFTASGETLQLTAQALDASGAVLGSITAFAWRSTNTNVVTVSSTGLVAAVEDGTATVTAEAGGVSGAATMTVARVPARVTISPATLATMTYFGQTAQLSATATDALGQTMTVPLSWRSLNTAVATVSSAGRVTAVANGTTGVEVTAGAVADTIGITVQQAVSFITITPRDRTFNTAGQTQTFTAAAFDAGANAMTSVTAFSWSSTAPGVASVGALTGTSTLVTAVADGTARISASVGAVADTADVTVNSMVASVSIGPARPDTIRQVGGTVALTATPRDVLGNAVAVAVGWQSLDATVASVSASGLVTGLLNGTARIVATAASEVDTVNVIVAQRVGYVTVTPSAKTLTSVGQTQQLSAVAFDAGGTAVSPAPTVAWSSSATGVATVDANGLVTAAGDGAATVTATAGGVGGTAAITVTRAIASIALTPSTRTFASLGETQSFTASALDGAGQVMPAVTGFTWSSSNRAAATVGSSSGSSTTVTAVADGATTISASSGGVTGMAAVTVARAAASVTLAPAAPSALASIGATTQLSATVADALGQTLAGATVSWTALDPGVATVSAGLVTAVTNGTARIVAASGSAADTVTVTVAQAVASIAVTPTSKAFSGDGDTLTFSAVAHDANGNALASQPSFTWASSDAAVATVGAAGLVTSVASGAVTVTASAGGKQGAASVTVGITVAIVEVSPTSRAFRSKGETETFTAVAKDGGGSVIASVTSFSWSTGNTGFVSIGSTSGGSTVGTAVANGTTTVTAQAGGVTGAATVTVGRVVSSVTISPDPPPTLSALGATTQLSATVADSLGEPMSDPVTWSHLDAGVATVGAAGLVTAVGNGSARIVATAGGKADTVTVPVAQVVSYLTVTPTTATFTNSGTTRQLTAAAFDVNDNPVSPAPAFAWASTPASVATVGAATGLVTAVADGQATVTASASSREASASITVARVVASVAVTPDPPGALTFVGDTLHLSAAARDSAGATIPGAQITWQTLGSTVATVSSSGVVTAQGNGSTKIVASSGAAADTVDVTVTQAVATVTSTPGSVALAPSGSVQLAAVARDALGVELTSAAFTWQSLNVGVATVSGTGLVTAGGADGATSVIVSSAGVADTVPVTVTSGEVTRTFTGSGSGDLLDPANWEPAGAPSANDSLVIGAGTSATLSSNFTLGSLVLEAGATLDVAAGATLELTGDLTATGAITGNGTVELSGSNVTATGTVSNLDITGTATVTGTLTVNGDLETDAGGILSMTDPASTLDVNGDLRLGGGDTNGELTSGTLYLSGELINVTTSFKTFNPSGTHTTIFNGTTPQTVTLEFPGQNQHRFQNIVVDNPAGVIFNNSIPILGSATILQGSLGGVNGSIESNVGGNITDASGSSWLIPTTVIGGAAPTLPASMTTDLVFTAATSLQNSFTVAGDVTVTGSSSNLDLNGHDLTVTGAFGVQDSGLLTMDDASSDLTVAGAVSFGGRSSVGALTAGRILGAGDFTWAINKETAFVPSGTHQVVLNGSGLQTISVIEGGNRVYSFQNLQVAAGATATMNGSLTVKGTFDLLGTFTIPVLKTLTIVGAFNNSGTLVNLGTIVLP